ncbi:MAG TPA: hypothetical protein VED59_08545, partial [Acidimicrobiales bacterium]|nr:hypothetical protein [Acidimicrobiales bacterium]
MFRFRRIRSKLIAAFAVPVAACMVVALFAVGSSVSQMASIHDQTSLALASVGSGGIVGALQKEREDAELSVLRDVNNLPADLQGLFTFPRYTAGRSQTAARIRELILQPTDSTFDTFRTDVNRAGDQAVTDYQAALTSYGASIAQARQLWVGLGNSPVMHYRELATRVFTSYTKIIDLFVNATSEVAPRVSDPQLRTGVEAFAASLSTTESDWTVAEYLFQVAWNDPGGAAFVSAANQATQAYGQEQGWLQRLAGLDRGNDAPEVGVLVLSASTIGRDLRADVGQVQQGAPPSMPELLASLNTQYTMTAAGQQAIQAAVENRSTQLQDNAKTQVEELAIITATAAVLGVLLVALLSRSISRPLVDLAHQADKLATEQLPASVQAILEGASEEEAHPPPVKVSTQDEVAEVGRALDAVNNTVLSLAAKQATLRRGLAEAFENLGRRNQNLVTRQLEYISEIELKESDPAALEELFRLDHLATRMRRNADSLLILAGSGPAGPWNAPVPAMDIVRAAFAEVEDYHRLRLHHF